MRPRGEVRELFVKALAEQVDLRGPVTCRQLAEATQVGYAIAARTLDNMVRAGEARVAGQAKPAGSTRWKTLYEPPAPPDPPPPEPDPYHVPSHALLAGVMQRFPQAQT